MLAHSVTLLGRLPIPVGRLSKVLLGLTIFVRNAQPPLGARISLDRQRAEFGYGPGIVIRGQRVDTLTDSAPRQAAQ